MSHGTETTLLSGASTVTRSSADQDTYGHARGAILFLDFTHTPNDAQTAILSIEYKDPASGKYVTCASFTAQTASVLGADPTAKTFAYTVYPAAAETIAAANHEVQALALPRIWRATVTHSAAGSWTYTLAYTEIA